MEKEMITITKERYEKLLRVEDKLDALECAGVDNWEGYAYAMEMLHENEDDEEERE